MLSNIFKLYVLKSDCITTNISFCNQGFKDLSPCCFVYVTVFVSSFKTHLFMRVFSMMTYDTFESIYLTAKRQIRDQPRFQHPENRMKLRFTGLQSTQNSFHIHISFIECLPRYVHHNAALTLRLNINRCTCIIK